MNNTMNFSPITRACNNMIKTYQPQSSRAAGSIGFYERLMENYQSASDAQGASGTENIDRAFIRNMTMGEYKQYIYDRIAALRMNQSNAMDSISVEITDEGFAAMKNDPEYERWVLDTLQKNFQSYDPWSSMYGGKMSVFHFGATKEEYRSESWRFGFRDGRERHQEEESFWDRRKRRRKEWLEQLKELDEKKAIAKKIAQSKYYTSLAAVENGERKEPINQDLLAMQIFSTLKTDIILAPHKKSDK